MGDMRFLCGLLVAVFAVSGCAADTTTTPSPTSPSGDAAQALDPRQGLPACPALDNGARLQLSPPLAEVDFVEDVDYTDPIFISAAVTAQNIASYFENAQHYVPGQASYDGIGALDDISIGQMQWNWKGGNGTLSSEFFKDIPNELLDDTTDAQLSADLATLARFANEQSGRQAAEQVIGHWQAYVDDRDSPLAEWLRSDGVRQHQDALVERRLGAALRLARTWMRDRNYGEAQLERVLTTFANFNIHTGLRPLQDGLRDVWAPQVASFMAALDNDRTQIFDFVIDWMRSCENVNVTKKKDAFGDPSRNLEGNVDKWRDPALIAALSDEQVELFAYAFVYATRSDTQFGAFPKGYSQLDVLQRAGVIVLDVGTALGADWDPSIF